MSGYIFVVSAPSAAGKTTLTNAILQDYDPAVLSRVVTYTTRTPRVGERDGVDYNFIGYDTFQQWYDAGVFIEASNAYGAWYGSAWHSLQNLPAGSGRILVIDRAGAITVKKTLDNVVLLWVMPGDINVLRKRMLQRNCSQSDIDHRVVQSQKEVEQECAKPVYDYWIYNDCFEVAYNQLKQTIHMYL